MLKSINNVSKELGISKATIYKKLKEEKYKKLIIKENNVIKINESLYELLKANTKRKNIEEVENVEIVDKEELNVVKVEENMKEDNVVGILLKQIEEKDIQINRLHDLIENNQILIKNSQEREKEKVNLEEHFKEIDKKLIEIRDRNRNKNNKLIKIFKIKKK
ncbi:MAG: hypothetical protein MR938_05050 [Tenericutes bacterium]|nr:hypothetical protein [Mycoplasmatota bacterium]